MFAELICICVGAVRILWCTLVSQGRRISRSQVHITWLLFQIVSIICISFTSLVDSKNDENMYNLE